jgi:arylsulfatase A-like enzyme
VAERAVDFVKRAAKAGQPFLLYVPFNAPHYPLHAPQPYKDRFPELPWDRQMMAAMLSAMDDGVGAIRDALASAGALDDTLLFFQSDNGPSRESRNWLDGRVEPYYGSRCPLKGHKFSLYEGGIRSPAIMSWPARIGAGRRVDEAGAAMDIFPTLLRAAGGDPSSYEIDGLDVMAMIAEGAPSPHREIFWEIGEQTAARRGKWKLVLKGQLVEGATSDDDVFLADLEADPGERANLRDSHPDLARELRDSAERWRRGIEERWDRQWRPRLAEVGATGYSPAGG